MPELALTPRMRDLTGQRFGKLVALRPAGKIDRKVTWLCQCDCGNQSVKIGRNLLKNTTSCGECSRVRSHDDDVAAFWSKVNKTEGCWIWTGALTNGTDGYGRHSMGGEVIGAHAASWLINHGPLAEGVCVLHKCDNPSCVRPDHLFVGDRGDNARDMAAKGRQWLQRNPKGMAGDRHWARRKPELVKRGVAHSRSKLTEIQILEIRQQYADGATMKELGQLYDTTDTNICTIVRGETWAHVGGPIFPNGRRHGNAKSA